MRNVSRNRNSSGRCPTDPGRERPYAASTVSVRLKAVPTAVTMTLTHTARATWPPEKMVMYADGSKPFGTTTIPPASLMVCREERLVTTTDHIGRSTAGTMSVSPAPVSPSPGHEGGSYDD